MKVKELTTKSVTELQNELARIRGELVELSVKLRNGEVKNVRSVSVMKKDIARILTILSSK